MANPFAWERADMSASEIREPTPDNRMIAFPYTKALVANNTVDMASAVLLCSVQAARDAGISTDRLVFPHAATTAHETWRLASRRDLNRVPALAAAGRHVLELAGIEVAEVDYVDLYACFPAIVQMSAEALGLDLSRQLTLTGGLGFAGAAIANSTGHALAAMVPLLREGGVALIHANGGNATKHAFGVYSHRPATAGFRVADSQPRAVLDERPRAGADAAGIVEAATVGFDRDGPVQVIATALTRHGERFFTRSRHPDVIAQAMTEGLVGASAPLP
jgi:acetyl-CoA C-acetyltransferase